MWNGEVVAFRRRGQICPLVSIEGAKDFSGLFCSKVVDGKGKTTR